MTNFGAISRTVWPNGANCRAQWCAPEQASMPITHGGSVATSSSSLARGTVGRRSSGLPALVDAVNGKNILGEIDTNGQNRHGLPLPDELMRVRTSHRGTQLPVAAMRLVRDGEVPFIR